MEIEFWYFYSALSILGVAFAVLGIGIPSGDGSAAADLQVATSSSGMQLAFAASLASASPMIADAWLDMLFSRNNPLLLSRLFGLLLVVVDIYALTSEAELPSAAIHWTLFAIREVAFNCSLFATLAAVLQLASIDVGFGSLQLAHILSAVLYRWS